MVRPQPAGSRGSKLVANHDHCRVYLASAVGTWGTALFDGDLASHLRTPPDRGDVSGTVAYPADHPTGTAVGTLGSTGPREQYLHGGLDEHIARFLESRFL